MIAGLTAVILFSGCGKNVAEPGKAKGSSSLKEKGEDIAKLQQEKKSPEPEEGVSKKIEAVTGNHSKLAWYQYQGKTADTLGNGSQLQLWGIDTRDGLGVRVILEKKSSYVRPLISPDGKWIIYTNKHTERIDGKKVSKPVVHRVDWKGAQVEELGKGYAVDIWEDPKTKVAWVYVAHLIPTNRSSMFADKLERFQLDDPKKRELVWDKTKISVDSIQLSKDGKRASCLFPWPDVGVIDLEKKEHWRNQHGCWPSLAPDNSYTAWVFDGSHKSVHLFADRGKKLSVVNINDGPGMDGHEMFHPRWANHPRFITVTGPYKGPSIGKSGKNAEVYIGEFDTGMTSIKNWVQVTDNKKGDHYPDLWIKGGEKESLGKIAGAGSRVQEPKAGKVKSWPENKEGLLFLWESALADNKISNGESERVCGVEMRQRARFGRHFEMLTGGGYFEIDVDSAAQVAGRTSDGDFALQLRLIANDPKQSGTILSAAGIQIRQEADDLLLLTKDGAYSLGNVKTRVPIHLAVSFQGGKWQFYRNGGILKTGNVVKSNAKIGGITNLTIGDGKWEGAVEGLAVYARVLTEEEIVKGFATLSKKAKTRKPAKRVKLRGKLVEMTAVRGAEELKDYNRALLVYTYEVEEVISGEYDQPKVYVNHWSLMEKKPLKSIPRKLGQSYILEIEHLDEHPELDSERRWSDQDLILEEYFDITTPEA
ncbi:MAG: LamG domain-containing protein [Verrucomicrobia bacterium]|nr:LamG domain-containing protein [Verrucomicrobiota bacterium]